MLLYWPHTSALVAYNSGTSVGHGPFRTLFLDLDFVPSADTLDVGHGPLKTLFLGLILRLDFASSANDTMSNYATLATSQLIGGHKEY